jgi:hypothetical protein
LEATSSKEEKLMANFAFFVSEQDVKKNTPIDENVDSKILQTAMRTAQDIQIRDIIGSGLYDKICDDINDAGLAGNYLTLVNKYIAPCLYHFIVTESMLPMTFKMMNKSVSTRGAENSNAIDLDQLTRVEQSYLNKAQYYSERLRDYLCENNTLFPEFLNPGSGIDTIHPQNQALFGGFILDSDDNCFYNYDFPKG